MRVPLLPPLLLVLGLAVPPAAAGEAAPEVSIPTMRAHVDFLADDLLEGRDTGSRGHEIAARYAASVFEQLGLAPGNGDSYFQRIPFARAERTGSELSVQGNGRTTRLAWREDYLVSPSRVAPRVEITAPVVFAGFGVEAPEVGHDDYAGLDVRGKIVLLLAGAPASFTTDVRAHYSSSQTKAETAIRHGAVGLLTMQSRADAERSPWQRRMRNPGRPSLSWKGPDGRIQNAHPELRVQAQLGPTGLAKLLKAAGEDAERLLDAVAAGNARPHALGIVLKATTSGTVTEITSPNVVALLPGSDPALAAQTIVVSAHLDHIGIGEPVDGDSIYNGYYDNAMGSSIVLELARLASRAAPRPRRSLLFLLVTGEEKGLLGADYFAHYPTVPRASLVADLNVDMPLLLAPVADLVALGGEHSSLGATAKWAAFQNGFSVSPDPHPEQVYFVRSDQYPFVREGIPALYLDTGTATRGGGDAAERAAEEFERDHYHRPSDQASLGTDWETAARYTATLRDILLAVANAAQAPTWNPGDFFGDRFGRHE